MTKRDAVVHPIFFALFPVLSLFVNNANRLSFGQVTGAALVVLISTIALWFLVNLLLKSREKSAIIVSVFLILFFSFGHLITAFTTLLYQLQLLDGVDVLVFYNTKVALAWLPFLGAIFGATWYLTAKSSGDFRLPTQAFNIISVCLVLSVGANWAMMQVGANQTRVSNDTEPDAVAVDWDSQQQNPLERDAGDAPTASDSTPDIYYIVLDGYARDDILKELYDIDNSENLTYLTRTGFYIADQSRSNYCQTALSLASSLNFAYLDNLIDQTGSESSNIKPLEMAIENNRLFRYLRDHNYLIWAFSTGHSPTEITSADRYLSPPWSPNSFQNELINTTPLTLFRKTQYDFHRERITYTFDHLADATQLDSPVFVFAHIIAPHPPFVFRAGGEPIQPDRQFTLFDGSDYMLDSTREKYVQGYQGQLAFITTRLRVVIEEILSRSPEPPIIILQADHGPGSMLDWSSAQNSNLRERLTIFNAYYFPDQTYEMVYPGITPVNTFRVILNHYFGTDYEILDDMSYYSTLSHPYLLVDVTDELTSGDLQ